MKLMWICPNVTTVFTDDSAVIGQAENLGNNDQMEKVSREMFQNLSCYLQTELSSTKDTYALLEVRNYDFILQGFLKTWHSVVMLHY